jgi:hypothetical protein
MTPDIIRELMAMKMIDMEMPEDNTQALDELLCQLLGIEDPDPIIYPS